MSFYKVILVSVLIACGVYAHTYAASPEDEQVAEFFKSHNMFSLLELQLEDRIRIAKNENERTLLTQELSELYLSQLRSYPREHAYRALMFNRASALVARMSSVPMYELRIELLIESYLVYEPSVELARLELLDPVKRSDSISNLQGLNRQLRSIASKLDVKIEQLKRSKLKTNKRDGAKSPETLADLRRYRSLAHYYHGWTGYSVAVLKDQHVPSGVFFSFGWLLGAEGEFPQFKLLNETMLEFDHVARSAIGVALSYAQSEDMLTARSWARLVAESEHTDPELHRAGQDRLLEVLAIDRDWTEVNELIEQINTQRDNETFMRVAQARFLALQSLGAMHSTRVGRGGIREATHVAQYAIEQLVEQGEIGHVLDLYRRFESLPMVANSFITNYAQALAELNQAEQAGNAGLYASVAAQFARALDSSDADRFDNERDDCKLKLAYCELRSGRGAESIKVCDELIAHTLNEQIIEEARWIRIAAIESRSNNSQVMSDILDQAVRQYITAYPSSARSARLILRYAMQGSVDAQVAVDTLNAIGDDDPIVFPARRTLVQLRYKQLRANGFKDQVLLAETLRVVAWINENQPTEITDDNDAQARMGTVRIGIDLSLRAQPPVIEFAKDLIEAAIQLTRVEPSLVRFRSELIYRQVEVAVFGEHHDQAMGYLQELEVLDSKRGQSARILIFNETVRQWSANNRTVLARRLIELGSQVLSTQTPPYPEPLGGQVSKVAEVIVQAGVHLWLANQDVDAQSLALRVSLMVLDRGVPSEPGLRQTAMLTAESGDIAHELDAWLRLLAAYPSNDERWYEARYESLRVLKEIDFSRALSAYDQFKVLHPRLGPSPWNALITGLFGDSLTDQNKSTGGDQP